MGRYPRPHPRRKCKSACNTSTRLPATPAHAAEIPTSFYAGAWRFRTEITCVSFFCTPRTRVECAQFAWAGTHDHVHAESAKVHATQARGCRRLQHVQPRSPSHFTQGRGDSARKSRTSRFFVLRGHALTARSLHGQVPTTTSTPKVQKCMQHKHAVAGDSSTCSRDPHLILRRGVAIPHGNHVRLVCCSPRTRVECAHYNDNTYDEDDIDARSPQTHASLLGSTLSVSLGWQRLGVAAVEQ